jgi:hypothetical protein
MTYVISRVVTRFVFSMQMNTTYVDNGAKLRDVYNKP